MPRMSRCCQCYPPVPDIVSTITVTSAVSGPDQRRSLCKAHQLTITMSGIKLVLLVRCLVWWRRRWLLLVGVSLCLTVSGAAAAVLPGCWLAHAATAEAAPHSSISIRPPTKYFSEKIFIQCIFFCKSATLRSFKQFLYFLHSKIWAHFRFGTFDPKE